MRTPADRAPIAVPAIPVVAAAEARRPVLRSLWTTVLLDITGAAFVALGVFVRAHPLLPWDLEITRAVQSVTFPWFHVLLQPFDVLGFPPVVGLVYGAIAVVIYGRGSHWAGGSCAFAGIGGAALNFVTKALVDRPRPPAELVRVDQVIPGSAFPAGHALNFTAFAGFLAYLAWHRSAPRWQRALLVGVLAVMIALMGLARIDSGEHWASDVLGGYLLGALWLAATIRFYRWGERRRRSLSGS